MTIATNNTNANSDGGGTFSGILADNGSGQLSLVKSGSSTTTAAHLTLGSANTFTGSTRITGGILSLGNANALQNSYINTTGSVVGTTTDGLRTTGAALNLGGLSGDKALSTIYTLSTGGYSSVTGITLNVALANNLSYSGVIDGARSLTKTGAGTQTLSGLNTYTGTTTISAGTLSASNIVVSGNSNLGNAATAVTLGAAGTQGTLSYTGNTATYTRGLTIGGAGGGRLDVTTSGQTLTVGTGDVTGTGLFTVGGAGNTTINSNVTHTGGLTKSDAGTLTLAGTNTYTGDTQVSAGTLVVNGTSSTSLFTVGNTATLKGIGSIEGSVTVQGGGTLAPGNSIGSLATGALNFESGSFFEYELNKDATPSVAGDLTAVTGNLTITDLVTLMLLESGSGSWELGTPLGDPTGAPPADKLTLIGYTGTWNGGLFTYNGNEVLDDSAIILNGQQWWFNYNDTAAGSNFTGDLVGGMSYVTLTVPEPSTALLGALGVLALLRRRRA